ncbi:methyltransferase domain-containing protein [Rhizobium calliandrae]|uniref:Methyltransferase domain-containing protein n=1 Tax=Rhizobium calliandrae TaxID=1312182 RepID=A0ABT7KGA9_9HYPH|nr:class I SAM-dependent methyltransferase [Rhizobium calliandrae]MDL2407656.1 methyltransferase domain-containing protein [Rhizobium calliandrae]
MRQHSMATLAQPIPESVFDDIAAFSGLDSSDAVLEIGCGTGQATQGFARRGVFILALDPGAELIGIARKNLAEFPNVRFAQTTLEAWPGEATAFKLVMAAQSLHWVASEVRLAKSAEQLAPGGTLAVLGSVPMPLAPPLAAEFARLYSLYAPSLSDPPAEAWYLPDGPFAKLLGESEYFEPTTHRCYPWSRMQSAASYSDLLRTLSSYPLLAADQREALLAALGETIATHGGKFELRYETHLYLAKRR